MLLKSISIKNFLSYGEKEQYISLQPLNIIIGPNGSGKTNLIEAIELLHAAPKDLLAAIRNGGGVHELLWKRSSANPVAVLEAILTDSQKKQDLRYSLSFTAISQRFELIEERIESVEKKSSNSNFSSFYEFSNGKGFLSVKGKKKSSSENIDVNLSILSQRKDPEQYPEVTYLGEVFSKIRLYREWSFGRSMPSRLPQKADLPNDYLEPDSKNLGLLLNRFSKEPTVKKKILRALQGLYEGITDYGVQIEGGTVQVFFFEDNITIPASRLSDGTLRYLCLLAILFHPNPPPLICIEEPELGLHPDVLPALAEILKEASERCQLIVTTHSDVLVDAMSDQPESVLVAERGEDGSTLTRLDGKKLKPWLEKYRLGQLWTRGEIGGTRW
ncbi:predicted ATPase [Hahella chejuensis KCTC 2396]|uniref:Predicted ATPase n=1 Tax=Hahella chejuensis (strain KCTC 2396) TaxID=349521 RepID=Q2SGK8_HAHCH|nr:AAA family ATPase [Hahella chejuensis]ABC30216.1 predicted ATPase [Hahella chejuensis KCTC 2396]